MRVTHIKQHLAHARVINYRNKSQYFIGLCLKFEILSREPPWEASWLASTSASIVGVIKNKMTT